MVESDAKAFAFRMPPELKAAAVALAKTHFSEWKEDGSQTVRNVNPSSINDALIYLMRTGVRHAAHYIEHDLNEAKRNVETWKGFIQFFLDNPSIDHVNASDFPEGSEMRRDQEIDDDNNKDTGAPTGTSREDAFEGMAIAQKLLTTRTNAKAALLSALKG